MTAGPSSLSTMATSNNDEPRYDLDTSALSLVKAYASGHGTTYPDMAWEPNEAFRAVAGYCAEDAAGAAAGE